MPLVIALVGIVGTYLITQQQHRNAEAIRVAQVESSHRLAAAEQEVKILDIFADKIISPDESVRKLALGLLAAVNGELAKKLATAVLTQESEQSHVGRVAAQVAAEAEARACLLRLVEPANNAVLQMNYIALCYSLLPAGSHTGQKLALDLISAPV